MLAKKHQYRPVSGYLLLLVVGLVLSSLPTRPVSAGTIDQIVDNNLTTFSDGTFQRAALSSTKDPRVTLKDDIGAIQLAPSGKLNSWGVTTPLAEPVSNAGVTSLGNRLYIIGGSVTLTNTSTTGSTSAAYWATASITNGNLLVPVSGNAWQNPDPLAPTKFTNDRGCDTLVNAERTGAAATSISTSGNAGYLYIIGGSVRDTRCNGDPISSIAVQIGTVAANGDITWANGPDFPSPEVGSTGISTDKLGIQEASAVSVRTTTGKAFIYVFGGLQRYQRTGASRDSIDSRLSKAVFFAEVNLANGSLGAWLRGPDIPVAVGAEGLWDGTAVGGRFDIGGGSQATRDALYITGGQTKLAGAPADYNARVWRADLDPSSGALTWDETPGESDKQVTLPSPVINLAGVAFNSKLYMIGGAPSRTADPVSLVPTAFFADDMNIDEIDNLPNTFFQGGGSSDSVLPFARQNHAVALIRAEGTAEEPSAAFVYVAGGSDNVAGNPTDTLFLGKIGTPNEADPQSVAPNGWYYADPTSMQVSGTDVTVLEIKWSAQIDRNVSPSADIKMEYRTAVTASGLCDGQGVFSDTSWKVISDTAEANLGGFLSTDGANVYVFPANEPPASCFQYRAFINRAGGTASPVLLNVSLKKVIPGSPDLRILANEGLNATVTDSGELTSIKVTIENKNDISPPTQPADIEARGGFFVDLCISEPNQPLTLPTLPITVGDGPPCSKAYAEVSRSTMTANAEFVVTGWRYSSGPKKNERVADLIGLFEATGTYQLAVVIDPDDLVPEGNGPGSPQELNNISSVLSITISVIPPKSILRLPMMRKAIP